MTRFTCADCHRTYVGSPRRTPSGRTLCPGCDDALTAAAAGVLYAGEQGGSTVGGAIATVGWWRRVRQARGKEPGKER